MNNIVNYFSAVENISDKKAAVRMYINYMLARTARMFRYENLPEHITERELELIIQSHGCAGIAQAPNSTDLYAMYGAPGGAPDAYLRPTKFVYANPALGSKVYDMNLDDPKTANIVLIPNDSLYQGLMPMFSRYATLIAENDLSIHMAEINNRLISILKADTDADKAAADKFINDIKDGKLSAILQQPMIDGLGSGLQVNNYATSATVNYMTQLIELQQYLKASWYNDIGLQANYNMKREAINSAEAALGNDVLVPLCDDMLKCRQEAVERINEMFGTDIRVEFASVWAENETEREEELANLDDAEAEQDSEPEETEEESEPDEDASESDDEPEENSGEESDPDLEEAVEEIIEEAVNDVIDVIKSDENDEEDDDDEQDD